MNTKIGLGGGCHWCTEGIFQSLIGISDVQQGWIASDGENDSFSEAVIVEFNSEIISAEDLIAIHLYTHSSTSNHSFRKKYRSAVYVFDANQKKDCELIIEKLQSDFENKIITQVLLFKDFKMNKAEQLNYLYTRKNNTFCKTYIEPKFKVLMSRFAKHFNDQKVITNDLF